MEYRLLDTSEYGLIEREFSSRGKAMPDPANSFVMGAFTHEQGSEKFVGFLVCQAQIHVEPLVLYDPRAFRGLLRAVERELMKQFPKGFTYFATTKDVTSGMAEAMGIKLVEPGLELRRKELAA